MVDLNILQTPLEDEYVLGEELGRGKFGVVNICKSKDNGEDYAAKFIRKRRGRVGRGQKVEDIHREIEIMITLGNHPCLVSLEGAYEDRTHIVMVMELLRGQELFAVLAKEDHFTEAEAIDYVRQILTGLAYIHHKGYIHLDMKPENIVLQHEGEKKLKIIDFGLAQKYNPRAKPTEIVGTPEFMAPETISFEPCCPGTDIWAVGVITYILLSGCSPFLGDDDGETYANITTGEVCFPEEYFSCLTPDMEDFILVLLAPDPNLRLSAEKSLAHKWLAPKKTKNFKRIGTKRLRRFNAQRKWQDAIHLVLQRLLIERVLDCFKECVDDRKKREAMEAAMEAASVEGSPTDEQGAQGMASSQSLVAISPRKDFTVERGSLSKTTSLGIMPTPRRRTQRRTRHGQVVVRKADSLLPVPLAIMVEEDTTAEEQEAQGASSSQSVIATSTREDTILEREPLSMTTSLGTPPSGGLRRRTQRRTRQGKVVMRKEDSIVQVPKDLLEIVVRETPMSEFYDLGPDLLPGRCGLIGTCTCKQTGEQLSARFINKQKTLEILRRTPEAIYREIEIIKQLNFHPRLVALEAVFEEPENIILVTEYFPSQNVCAHLASLDSFTEATAMSYLRQLLNGVAYIHHNNLAHLDLRLENIVVQGDDLRIIDFSMAQDCSGASPWPHNILGTLQFMSPELLFSHHVSPSADMWAVGVIAYIIAYGTSPFLAEYDELTEARIAGSPVLFPFHLSISTEMQEFILTLLERNIEHRSTARRSLGHKWLTMKKAAANNVIQTEQLQRFMKSYREEDQHWFSLRVHSDHSVAEATSRSPMKLSATRSAPGSRQDLVCFFPGDDVFPNTKTSPGKVARTKSAGHIEDMHIQPEQRTQKPIACWSPQPAATKSTSETAILSAMQGPKRKVGAAISALRTAARKKLTASGSSSSLNDP